MIDLNPSSHKQVKIRLKGSEDYHNVGVRSNKDTDSYDNYDMIPSFEGSLGRGTASQLQVFNGTGIPAGVS